MKAEFTGRGHLKRGCMHWPRHRAFARVPLFGVECAVRSPMFKPGDSAMGVAFGYMIAVFVWLRALFLECRDLARERNMYFEVSRCAVITGLCSIYGVLRLSGILDFGRTYPDDRLLWICRRNPFRHGPCLRRTSQARIKGPI